MRAQIDVLGLRSTAGAHRSREEGSIILAAALCMFLIMGMTLAGMILGRQAYTRREMQTAVDGLALMSAHRLQQHGIPYTDASSVYAKTFYTSGGTNAVIQSAKADLIKPTNLDMTFSRHLIHATLKGRMSTWQKGWFPTKHLDMTVQSYAQTNEQYFGDRWPIIIFALDASESMNWPTLGSSTKSAWEVLSQLFLAYASNTLPVRNGVVIFANSWLHAVGPSFNSANKLTALKQAVKKTNPKTGCPMAGHVCPKCTPYKGTNTYEAMRQTRILLNPWSNIHGKNVILITDGEPTRAAGCPNASLCCFTKGRQWANLVRTNNYAHLFTVEIRRTNYTAQATTFLRQISGAAGSSGSDKNFQYQVQSVLAIQAFLNSLTRSICAFGPLKPRPGTGLHAQMRPRGSRIRPDLNPRRIFAFLKWGTKEVKIPKVKNRDTNPLQRGWEYYTDPKGDVYVILSLQSCNDLGANAVNRLVVRWGEPALVAGP